MHITLRVARGIKSFIPMVYVKLLIYHWPFPDILWWVCGQCYANPLIRWPDSSFLCVLSTNQHMSLPDCFVLCVCSHLYMTAHVCMYFVFVWGWMFEHVQYATVYSSMIIFAPTNTNWRHSALGVETQSPDPHWPLIYLLKHWGRERRSWIKE